LPYLLYLSDHDVYRRQATSLLLKLTVSALAGESKLYIRCSKKDCGNGANPRHDRVWDIACGVPECDLKQKMRAYNRRREQLLLGLLACLAIVGGGMLYFGKEPCPSGQYWGNDSRACISIPKPVR
jgi:hypothetical protein